MKRDVPQVKGQANRLLQKLIQETCGHSPLYRERVGAGQISTTLCLCNGPGV